MNKQKTRAKTNVKHKFDSHCTNTSASNQRNIILNALKDSPKTTIELRANYEVMMPAARIKELRGQGNKIDTVRMSCPTDDGIKHKGVAKYVLIKTKPANALN